MKLSYCLKATIIKCQCLDTLIARSSIQGEIKCHNYRRHYPQKVRSKCQPPMSIKLMSLIHNRNWSDYLWLIKSLAYAYDRNIVRDSFEMATLHNCHNHMSSVGHILTWTNFGATSETVHFTSCLIFHGCSKCWLDFWKTHVSEISFVQQKNIASNLPYYFPNILSSYRVFCVLLSLDSILSKNKNVAHNLEF